VSTAPADRDSERLLPRGKKSLRPKISCPQADEAASSALSTAQPLTLSTIGLCADACRGQPDRERASASRLIVVYFRKEIAATSRGHIEETPQWIS
jgi:hypothetical protein